MTEVWDVYAEDRAKSGRTHVRGLPLKKGDYHLVVVVWVLNPDGRILISLRHPGKPAWPGYWECTGGAALAGEDSLTAALREVKEEMGVDLDPGKGRMVYSLLGEDTIYDYWAFVQAVELEDTVPQETEVTEIKFASPGEIREMVRTDRFIPTLASFLDFAETDELLSKIIR
jgi:8-oxo-dGTP diphosphatase